MLKVIDTAHNPDGISIKRYVHEESQAEFILYGDGSGFFGPTILSEFSCQECGYHGTDLTLDDLRILYAAIGNHLNTPLFQKQSV